MKNQLQLAIALFFGLLSFQSNAQTSNLSIQGILRTAEGLAVENGDYNITFKLYATLYAGEPLWEESINNVPVKGGIYSTVLGTVTNLDLPFDQPYYLGITVEGGIELSPRARLTSSPYALSLIGDDNIFPNSGNVGVGSADPQSKLTVQRGNGTLGLEATEDANNTTVISTTADGMSFDAGGTDKVYAFPNGRIRGIADEQLSIEGVDTSQLIFTKNSGSATLGFDATNGDTLMLTNSIGATKIEGNNITLNTSSGTATIEGNTVIEGNTTMNGNTTANGTIEINKDGEALKLVGVDESYISFYPKGVSNGQKSLIGYSQSSPYGANDLTFYNSQSGNMIFHIEGGNTTSEYLFKAGRVFIQGYKAHYYSESPDRAIRGNHAHWGAVGNYNMGLMVSLDIGTRAVNLWSDKRIKKDFKLSNNKADLKLLQQIEVTNYRHIDEKANGTGITKGFIAQQIASIYPAAINKSTNAIPSILSFPSEVKEENGMQIIKLEKKHELEVGSVVKILTETKEEKSTVSSIIDPYTFVVKLYDIKVTENIFIYGQEVNDFHAVDYNKIFTLNVSATQELARKFAALEKQNVQLLKQRDNTKAELKTLSNRMKAMEDLLNSTSSN